MADLNYIDSNYFTPDHGFYVYTADAGAAIASASSLTASCGVITNAVSNMTVTATQTAVISHIEGVDLFAMSNASLAAEVARIRDNNIDATAAFSIATDASRTRSYSSDESADFTIAIDNLRVRFDEAALDAAFSLAADADKLRSGAGDLFATTAIDVSIERIKQAAAELTADVTVFADLTLKPGLAVNGFGEWTSQFDIDAKGSKKANVIDSDNFVTSELTASGDRIRFGQGQLESQFVWIDQGYLIASGVANLSTTSEFTAINDRVRDVSITCEALFSPAISVEVTKNSFAVLDSVATVVAQVNVITESVINASSTAEFTAIANVTKETAVDLSSSTAQSVIVLRLRSFESALAATSTVTVTGAISNRRPRQVTPVGAPQFSTNRKFGSHSIYLPEPALSSSVPANYLKIPNSGDFSTWGTVDFWINHPLVSNRSITPILSYKTAGSNASTWALWLNGSTSASGGYLVYTDANGQTTWINNRVAHDSWQHLHLRKSGGVVTAWLNGTLITPSASATHRTTYTTTLAEDLRIGWWEGTSVNASYLDDLIIRTDAVAGGTVPTEQITVEDQSSVQMLFHFNNDYVDDMTAVAQGAAALTSTATITAQADPSLRTTSANLQVQGFVVAATGRIRAEVADLDSQFVLTAASDKVKNAQAALTSEFALTASGSDLDLATADLTAQFTVSASAVRIKTTPAALTTTASITARATKTIASWAVDTWARGSTTQIHIKSITTDSDSIYEIGNYDSILNVYPIIKRELTRGTVIWQTYLKTTIDPLSGHTPIIRYANNKVYVSTGYYDPSYGTQSAITILDTDGNILEKKRLNQFYQVEYMQVDANGDVYVSGQAQGTSNTYPLLAKITGTTWARSRAEVANTLGQGHRVEIVNGNVYWSYGLRNLSSQNEQGYVVKFNSAGTEQWTQSLNFVEFYNFGVDSAENVIAFGATAIPLSSNSLFVKFDSTGSLVWTKAYDNIWQDTPFDETLAIDADGNAYSTFRIGTSINYTTGIISISSNNGSLRWGRSLSMPSAGLGVMTTTHIVDNTLFIGGQYTGGILLSVSKDTGGGTLSNIGYTIPGGGTYTWSWNNYVPNTISLSYALGTRTTTGYSSESITITETNNYTIDTNSGTGFNYFYGVSGYSTQSAQFTQTAQASKSTGLAPQNMQATASMVPQASKIAQLNTSLSSQFTQTPIVIRRTRPAESSITAQASLVANARKTVQSQGQFSSTATINAVPYDFTKASADLTSTIQLSLVPSVFRTESASITATVQQTTQAVKTVNPTITTDAIATSMNVVNMIGQGFIDPVVFTTTMSVQPIYTGSAFVNLTATTQQTAVAGPVYFGQAITSAEFQQTTQPDYLRRNESIMSATANLTADNARTRDVDSQQTANFGLTANTTNSKITGYFADLAAEATILSNNQIVRLASADLQAVTTSLFIITVIVRTEAYLTAFDTQLTVGDVINIDPYYQLKIPSETRALDVHQEHRVLTIESETRVNIIKGYI